MCLFTTLVKDITLKLDVKYQNLAKGQEVKF